MKKNISILLVVLCTAAIAIVWAADHIDSPNVTNQSTDITDVYVFRGSDPNNLVFVANTQGLLSPSATGAARFDANTLLEFNIDLNNDKIEDLVLQAKADGNGNMVVYGPSSPSERGARSRVEGSAAASVAITPYGNAANIGTGANGIKVFAGPRDDPFFFDLTRYMSIIGGTATSFTNPGNDSFAGTNVLSVVIEMPKSLLGNPAGGMINVWLETKKRI